MKQIVNYKVVFYLMNMKGYITLKDYIDEFGSSHIEYIVLSNDKNIVKDYYYELLELIKDNGIMQYGRNDNIPEFEGYKIAIGWRWIIEDTNKLIVLHDSILPKYRGFAPLVNMLINEEKEIGVTALFASDEYDKGDIIKIESIVIQYPIKIKDAISRISSIYSSIVIQIANQIHHGNCIIGTPQNDALASYSVWRDEKDYFINWENDSKYIRRCVDSLGFPYNGARTYLDGELIIIDEVEEYGELNIENRTVGKVLLIEENKPIVICGKGLIKIISAKDIEGKPVLPLSKFRCRFGGKQ